LALTLGVCGDSEAASAGPLSLAISPSDGNSEYLALLPPVLTIELKNESGTTQSINESGLVVGELANRQTRGRYRVDIRKPDMTSQSAYLSDWVDWTAGGPPAQPQYLGPSRKQLLDYCLGFAVTAPPKEEEGGADLRKRAVAVFDKTGEYEIRFAVVPLTSGPLESNPLKITIVQPKNPADVRAYQILAQSRWPEMFLSPLCARSPFVLHSGLGGVSVLTGPPLEVPATSSPLAICTQIITLCPDSAYAPYARMFFASALASGWAECLAAGQGGQPMDLDKRTEGIRLLRQAAADPALPRRYRERGLLNLMGGTEDLSRYIQSEGRRKLPTLESVLGVKVEIGGLPDETIFELARNVARGRSPAEGFYELLRTKLTPTQCEKLMEAATSDPNIAVATGYTPLQEELRGYGEWARAELCKIPWRDPNTGQLNLAGVPLNVK
jgi:hypothetical protein